MIKNVNIPVITDYDLSIIIFTFDLWNKILHEMYRNFQGIRIKFKL